MTQFKITPESTGQRLDKFLVTQFPELSRSQIQKLIKSGAVLLNNKPIAVHYFLKEGDVITIDNNFRVHPSAGALPSKTTLPSKRVAEAFTPRPEIIADTPDYLIINKPAGLVVHEAPGVNEPTLVDWLLEKYPEIKKIGEDPSRPAIVHRLDKEVSGLMVIPKTQDMFDHLKSQFKTRKINKEYTALVYGAPQKPEGEISFNIDRSVKGHKMAAIPLSDDSEEVPRGRKAITKFEVIEKFPQYTLLKVSSHTGRTHQIRVHLNAYGLPIVGDETYKPKKLKSKISIGRIFLHASSLGFNDLNNSWQQFTLPLPEGLQKVLKSLQKN